MMMQWCRRWFVCFICLLSIQSITGAADISEDTRVPAYAKWGLLAVQQTKERYPKADLIDYLHIGRETKSEGVAVEKFKLWLREGTKEFGVFIDVEFDVKTERVRRITFQETTR